MKNYSVSSLTALYLAAAIAPSICLGGFTVDLGLSTLSDVEVDDSFTVQVSLNFDAATDVVAFGFDVLFDDSVLELTGHSFDPAFAGFFDGSSGTNISAFSPSLPPFPPLPVTVGSGSVILADLEFKAIEVGSSAVGIQGVLPSGGLGYLLPMSIMALTKPIPLTETSAITVIPDMSGGPAIPEPNTLSLTAMVIGLLFVGRRRCR